MDKITFDKAREIDKQINYLKSQKEIWTEAIRFRYKYLCLIDSDGRQRSVDVENDIIDFETLRQFVLCEINSRLLELEELFNSL